MTVSQLRSFRSTDGSQRYREITQAGPSTFGFAVCAHPHDEQTAWFVPGVKDECWAIGSSTGGLWISEDGGDHWQGISNTFPQIYTVRFSRRA